MAESRIYNPTCWAQRWQNSAASRKAYDYATRLYNERAAVLTAEQRDSALTILQANEGTYGTWPNAGDVSLLIDRLLAVRGRTAPAPAPVSRETSSTVPVSEPGFYLHAETLYRVQESRSSGRLYAKILIVDETPDGERKGRFEYANGAVYRLQASERLTAEQAARLGHAYGFCVRCTKALDDPRSVAAGYGETCASREGWHYPTAAEAAAVLGAQSAA